MANFRDSLDALNALIDINLRTNELLEKMIESKATKTTDAQKSAPENKPIQRRGRQKK